MALAFLVLYAYLGFAAALSKEGWRSQSIYQLLTDRYARTNGSQAACSNLGDYCGGSWQGIINNLDYIQDMGFTAIWISPITENIPGVTYDGAAFHGFWPQQINQVNSNFGTAADLKALSDALHQRGMYLMVDMVTNDMAWNGNYTTVDYSIYDVFNDSSYYHPYCPITDYQNSTNAVECWSGDQHVILPDLATENSVVLNKWETWVSNITAFYGIDGIRLDACLEQGQQFFTPFETAAGVYIICEVYDYPIDTVCDYQNYVSGLLNFPMWYLVIDAFGSDSGSMTNLYNGITEIQGNCTDVSLLGNFVENHDVDRLPYTVSDSGLDQNAIAFVMLNDGIPIIYAGEEQHYSGGFPPADRETTWTSGYDTTNVYYQLIKEINAFRKCVISRDPTYVTTNSVPFYLDTQVVGVKKGSSPATQVVSVFNNRGTGAVAYTINLNNTGWTAGEVVYELYTAQNVTVTSGGSLPVSMYGGQPRIYYLASSYQCCSGVGGGNACLTTSSATTSTTPLTSTSTILSTSSTTTSSSTSTIPSTSRTTTSSTTTSSSTSTIPSTSRTTTSSTVLSSSTSTVPSTSSTATSSSTSTIPSTSRTTTSSTVLSSSTSTIPSTSRTTTSSTILLSSTPIVFSIPSIITSSTGFSSSSAVLSSSTLIVLSTSSIITSSTGTSSSVSRPSSSSIKVLSSSAVFSSSTTSSAAASILPFSSSPSSAGTPSSVPGSSSSSAVLSSSTTSSAGPSVLPSSSGQISSSGTASPISVTEATSLSTTSSSQIASPSTSTSSPIGGTPSLSSSSESSLTTLASTASAPAGAAIPGTSSASSGVSLSSSVAAISDASASNVPASSSFSATVSTSATPAPATAAPICPSADGNTFTANGQEFVVGCGIASDQSYFAQIAGTDIADCVRTCTTSTGTPACQAVTYSNGFCYLKSEPGAVYNEYSSDSAFVISTPNGPETVVSGYLSGNISQAAPTCPDANGNTFESNGYVYVVGCNIDNSVVDISTGPGADLATCVVNCVSFSGTLSCAAVTYNNGSCHFKASVGTVFHAAGANTAFIIADNAEINPPLGPPGQGPPSSGTPALSSNPTGTYTMLSGSEVVVYMPLTNACP